MCRPRAGRQRRPTGDGARRGGPYSERRGGAIWRLLAHPGRRWRRMCRMERTDPDSPGLASVPPGGRGEHDLDRLLRRVARGDQLAFETVYEQRARPIYGVIRRVLRDPAQSEEVTQEVLLEVWRTASRFDPAQGRA